MTLLRLLFWLVGQIIIIGVLLGLIVAVGALVLWMLAVAWQPALVLFLFLIVMYAIMRR